MNKLRLYLGIGSLVLAAVLATLYFTLPSDSMMFMVGDTNLPWVPAVVFGVVGVWLLATAPRRGGTEEEPAEAPEAPIVIDPAKAALNKRLETIAVGLFLVIWGCYMFVPKSVVSEGIWSIIVGLIMLGLNGMRYLNKLRMSGFTTVLGIISLIGGVLQLVGVKGIEGALLLIILGAYLIVKPQLERRQLFGKAEQA